MNNLLQRLLLFFVGVPALLALVVFLPQFHHAAMMVVVLVFTVGGSLELASLFRSSGLAVNRPAFAATGLLVPGSFYAATFLPPLPFDPLLAFVAVFALASFVPYSFSAKERLPESLSCAAAQAFALFYTGILGGFVTLIIAWKGKGTEAILAYAAMVIMNDSLAWLFGVTLGRRRNLVAVSPNKSLAGFIGGLAGSCGGALAIQAIFPDAMIASRGLVLLMGLVVGIAVIVGDLFESALKRSAGAKDSGSSIPGRGGFLDSFDSLLFAAPVFYAGTLLLGLFR
jgi:phosphatidate cytidylyltransferase